MIIELPFPAKALWPNGRANHFAKAREVKKHKGWAQTATLEACQKAPKPVAPIALHYVVYPKTRHAVDRDNCVSAMKSYQDGIALTLGLNDSQFGTPTIEFGKPGKPGKVEVVL